MDTVVQPTEVNEHQLKDPTVTAMQEVEKGAAECAAHPVDEELPLDEMPDGVVDSSTAWCAAAACVSDLGVVDFSKHGHVRAGTIKTRAYDALRKKMKQHLTEEQTLSMAQVQPICKLQNATLCEGLALVSSEGELMLYRAILMDTGANCNIISIAVVRRLGLTVYEASTGAKVTRCDYSPTKFTHYWHVDVILAAGTPHMTLHRLHAFVTFEPDNSWDLLVGTGPLKNSLMIDIKLGSGVAVSHAPSVLGMDAQVILPLVDMTPPKRPNSAMATEVDWKSIDGVWDPWAGTGVISEVMVEEWPQLRFMNNDWNPQLGWSEARDALQPGNYRIWKEKYGVCDAVVISPWFAALDIAVPLAVMASHVVACVHVPSYYLTDMTESRATYFRRLSQSGRLHVIGHLEHGPIGRRCMWVLVFKNPLVRARMLQGGEGEGIGMFTFSLGKFMADGDTTQYAEQAHI
ncbi:hypothetical protein CYMTET_17589 [Cymbomonas tetramitiformis]|uniref:Uncharacterized protein n=1 Tax=Cymbomonas tetramitiformis TaxID=36881 RepID=A0AAE0GA29_9CHLO|nr:hypothetical protein CYMTET_17589 [Cymbomonas tetramitiformis]